MTFYPRSFLWRTILMILVPLVISQIIVGRAFFGNHWKRVHAQMARFTAGEVATLLSLMDENPDLAKSLARDVGINLSVHEHLNRPKRNDNEAREIGELAVQLNSRISAPVSVYISRPKRLLFIDVPRDGQIVTFAASLRRVYSSSVEAFILWLAASALFVCILVAPFVILHTRSIKRIARAAHKFGRGLDAPGFKPSGSHEIREAAHALITMKERLNRYNRTRTDMLNAVSHDLKTPLARMRLAVETDSVSRENLMHDIDRLSEMVNGYLAFARGEIPEIEEEVSLPTMLLRIARDTGGDKKIITNFPDAPLTFFARPTALASAFHNIIENAARHAKSAIEITETDSEDQIEITIDDDGPGIPENKRADAMRPFVRLDESRSENTGGTGLGLSIAQTAIENHGGQMLLENAPLGGLRVRIVLPV